MIFHRVYDDKLAQAGYLIGCPGSGEAIVIDPSRDIEPFLHLAKKEGLRIAHITETHIHADYLSGSRELANHTGATLYVSDEGDDLWKYAFRDEPGVVTIRDGDTIRTGAIRLDVVATPGHTPEHITFVLTDEAASSDPLGAFTGDFLFVGDVGRPDLLERAAGFAGTMEAGAKVLYQTIKKFTERFSDGLLIWPGHGSGSACGKALGGVPHTSLGYERITNWALRPMTEDEFVVEVLQGQPEAPVYFKHMKAWNKQGPTLLADLIEPKHLSGDDHGDSAQWIDIRPPSAALTDRFTFAWNLPLGKSFPTHAGSLLSYDAPLRLIVGSEEDALEAIKALRSIGLDRIDGWILAETLSAKPWVQGARQPIESFPAESLAREGDQSATILDVRQDDEFTAGHIEGALHIPLSQVPQRAHEIPEGPLIVHCAGGGRSAIACSLLQASGREDVKNLAGGFEGFAKAGGPVASGSKTAVSIS